MSDNELFKILFDNYDSSISVEEYFKNINKILNEVYYQLKNK